MSESYFFSGRIRKPLYKKINPIWWFLNDDNQTAYQATWYHPDWPEWLRRFVWTFFRNPMQNFRSFVMGVQDRNYTVTGKAPVTCIQRDDLNPPETGWQWCVLHTLIPLPFASYSGEHWVFQFGWQYNGFFAFVKINYVSR